MSLLKRFCSSRTSQLFRRTSLSFCTFNSRCYFTSKLIQPKMTSQQQRMDEIRAAINKAREKFRDDKEKYEEFYNIIKDYRAQRINLAGFAARLKKLFKGHRDLFWAFNNVLPLENKIKLSYADGLSAASKFADKLKTRLQDDHPAYKLFWRMMIRRNTPIVDEIARLLQGHADLREEFIQYIVHTKGATFSRWSVQNTLLDGGGSAITTEQQMHVDKSPGPTKMSIQLMEYGHDKPKATDLSMDHDKKSRIFLKRNIRKYACSDESLIQAMEGLQIIDGLKSEIACNSSKVSYVLNTEDVLIRKRSKRRTLHQNDSWQELAKSSSVCSSRALRFHKKFSFV